ncbi:3-oxoacyl-[acyl-carrier-protein] synthase III C-terminal domain-containing protein [Clostridium felsineum]|uniref:3-oxoacyl-[acyl-carrier-protein] synthase III C-terminal domain-containing protein n=1 Tax=Clostridium felsineum TaxID=36839 RepID=UPI00098C1D3E|nr:3-oxoacyl-ACP synthase III family protein [Clostridium felsineum]URZ00200.1 3-oxoacyl-[acyl-carrier-protein] synthase 3 [Clostridium felsineum]
MFNNIVITGIGTTYPKENVTTYEDIEKHFEGTGIRVKSLMKILGKSKRFSIDENMDYFDFAKDASDKALKNANIKAEDLDIIVVVTSMPEYLAPANAIKLGKKLNATNVKVAYDMNATCAGAVVAIEQISRYLLSSKEFSKAMITTVFIESYVRDDKDPIDYSVFSDSAASVILEKKEEDTQRGFIDSSYKTDCSYDNMNVFPKNGFKDMLMKNNREDGDIKVGPNAEVNLDFIPDVWNELLLNLLKKNALLPSDIKKYFFSQFSLYHIVTAIAKLHLKKDKYVYVGDMYGYNGICSPIFSLEYGLDNKLVTKDDYIVLCAIGAGYTTAAVLYKL